MIAHNNLPDKAIREPHFRIAVRNANGELIGAGSVFAYNFAMPGEDFVATANTIVDTGGIQPANIEVEYDKGGIINLDRFDNYSETSPLSIARVYR